MSVDTATLLRLFLGSRPDLWFVWVVVVIVLLGVCGVFYIIGFVFDSIRQAVRRRRVAKEAARLRAESLERARFETIAHLIPPVQERSPERRAILMRTPAVLHPPPIWLRKPSRLPQPPKKGDRA